MPNPLLALVDKHLGLGFVPRLKQQIFGLAEDFWVDGSENLLSLDFSQSASLKLNKIKKPKAESVESAVFDAPSKTAEEMSKPNANLWHAAPGEISEKMWGEGTVTPGDEAINSMLIGPLGLTKDLSVLDLSAGLGDRIRRTTEETGASITGLEPDVALAERGMQLSVKAGKGKPASIAHYNPAQLVLDRAYDCVIARELFYRIPDRQTFLAMIAKNTKPQAQIAFTDYILDPEHREHPAVLVWKKNETLANPMGLVEAAEVWSKAGFSLRVHEDLTDFYKAEVKTGMARLIKFLSTGVRPDKETGLVLLRRIETWMHRMAAMNAGMKFYRFYGAKR